MSTALKSILYYFGIGPNPVVFEVKDDASAIRSDWEKVGADLRKAMIQYEKTTTK
ncbi:MAG: hypothetical protein IJ635_00640 [Bacteroidaceae bacterium]|nr:hypothetical protein [Bacteroidaceae bacterium]